MAKSRRFSTTALVITTLVVLIITLVLAIWLPTPEELAAKRTFAELSQVHIGLIRWSDITLEEAVADVNAQLEKKGETHLRLFVSDAFFAQTSPTISMQLEEVPVTECARYLCDLCYASMSASREGLTFGPHGLMREVSWRVRVRRWILVEAPDFWHRLRQSYQPSHPNDPFAPAGGR